MPWYPKETPTPFDNLPIPGLYFLIGDILAERWRYTNLRGHKYPEVEFPSGESLAIWEGLGSPIIHVFGEMDVLLNSARDEAFLHVDTIAEACGYLARKVGEHQIDVLGHEDDEYFRLTYDNAQMHLVNVERITDEPKPDIVHPAHQLMTDDLREKLPPLYANEALGMTALAVVKYFTPDSDYTWYASEFDGEDIFFGLVVGAFMELGYFSLSELQSVRGHLDLPVERDLYFDPKPLAELKAWHEKHR